MSVVVGLAPGENGAAVVHLGSVLARSTGQELVVAAIVPEPWPPTPYLADEEYLELQRRVAEQALQEARAIVAAELAADRATGPGAGAPESQFLTRSGSSVTAGLLEVIEHHRPDLVVLGSSGSGLPGRVSLGSVAQRILHSLDTPVCFAPADYRAPAGARLSRITVGFGRADDDSGLLREAVRRAGQLGLPLRVACFAVGPSTALQGSIELDAEELVAGEWAQRMRSAIAAAVQRAGADPADVEIAVGAGIGWGAAIAAVSWTPTDLLAVGAKSSAISRFLLGSHAAKIVRHAPVPVLTVARGG